jgi:glutaredoxin-related protein
MSSVLYYSKYCENCKKLLYEIGKTKIQKNMHFLSIDKRIQKNEKWYIVLDNGKQIFLPPNIVKVPSLLLLNKGNKILIGDDVLNFLRPQIYQEKQQATQHNMEPLAFSIYEMGSSLSDNYSYLDQTSEEMSAAKGNGGMRQMHSFVKLNQIDKIQTPPEDYEPDKVGEVDLGKIQAQRANDIKSAQSGVNSL